MGWYEDEEDETDGDLPLYYLGNDDYLDDDEDYLDYDMYEEYRPGPLERKWECFVWRFWHIRLVRSLTDRYYRWKTRNDEIPF